MRINRECIEACQRCAIACEQCLNAMIGMDSDNECPRCCRECIDLCLLCAQAMAREPVRFASCAPKPVNGVRSNVVRTVTIIVERALKLAETAWKHAARWRRTNVR